MNKKPVLLVTGASGFTGQYLLRAAKKHNFFCVSLTQNKPDTSHETCSDQTLAVNLIDARSVNEVVCRIAPDYVVHLAAVAFVGHGNVADFYQTNLVGTTNLLDAVSKHAPSVKKILIASSANVYGNVVDMPITEKTYPGPVNHYGMSKLCMEMAARLYLELPITIVRPFNYTGPGQATDFLVPKIVRAFATKQSAIELGNVDVSRDFSDVRDVVDAYLKILQEPRTAPLFNICTGTAVALKEIIDILSELAGYEIKIKINPKFVRSEEINILYGSPALLEGSIGQYRKYTLEETLSSMYADQLQVT